MIIDWYYNHSSSDERPSLYLRTRGEDGVLIERHIHPDDEEWCAPFCWVKQSIPDWKRIALLRRYPMASIDRNTTAMGLDGEHLWKLEVEKPNDLWEIKNDYPLLTYEADVQYIDQVLLQLYPDKLPVFKPRIWYFDLEWDPEDDFTTVMSIDDTHGKCITFAWKEDGPKHSVEWIDRVRYNDENKTPHGGYELHLFDNEQDMHNAFLDHMDVCNPDILVAHAIMWADLPHLMRRLDNPKRLSPLGEIIRPSKKSNDYRVTAQPIRGRLTFDTSARWQTGSGFEGVWQKSGKGQMPSRKLDWIANELGFGGKLEMDVYTGWYERFDDYVDYCMIDTSLLRKCDEKLNCIPFHLALQNVCGVAFNSTHKVSRYFRGLIGRRTELKAPSIFNMERPKLDGGWVKPAIPGRHEGVAVLDFASLYPNIILSGNFCWTTKRDGPGEGILSLGNGTHWDQTKKGLLPSVVEEMLIVRKEYKRLMKAATSDDEKLAFNMLQSATKVAVNAIYGYCGAAKFAGMWTDYDIARSITYKGREAISMLVMESEKLGYKALAGHTDSVYVTVPQDKAQWLAEYLTDVSHNDLKMKYLDVEWEGYFPYWTATGTNMNFGTMSYPPEDKGKMKITGFEAKSANAAPLTKRVQLTAFEIISNGGDEDDVFTAIRPIVNSVIKHETPLSDITTPTRLNMAFNEYVQPGNGVRAAMHHSMYCKQPFRVGESVPWVFVDGVPDNRNATKYMAYREPDELDGYSIDWYTTLEKLLSDKLKKVYQTLEWDLDKLVSIHTPKNYGF